MDLAMRFSESVRAHFAFLIVEHGCEVVQDAYVRDIASYEVVYERETRRARLRWGLKDGQLYFAIERVDRRPSAARGQTREADTFYIFALARYHEPSIDLHLFGSEMSPYDADSQRLELAVEQNAQYLRRYGSDILAGRSWFNASRNHMEVDGLHG